MTLDSRPSPPVALPPEGGGVRKQGEIVTRTNTGLCCRGDAECSTTADCSTDKLLCFSEVRLDGDLYFLWLICLS